MCVYMCVCVSEWVRELSFPHYICSDQHTILYFTAVKPISLTVQPVNASSVRVSWSNNPCVPTSLTYTSHFTATGSAVSGHELVLPSQQTSAVVSVSERPGHLHNFTIHYILSEGMMATAVSEIFSFGNTLFIEKAHSS